VLTLTDSDRRLHNMAAMIGCVRLDLDTFARQRRGLNLASAVRVCRACPTEESCRAWLAQVRHASHVPSFCPNAPRFNAAAKRVAIR